MKKVKRIVLGLWIAMAVVILALVFVFFAISKGIIGYLPDTSELENPESRKLVSLFLRLIPSALCTLITVSVILTAKDGLTVTDVLNGILKLSALPVAAFRGYSQGYTYAKHSLSLWLDTKSGILEGYLNKRGDERKAA